MIAKNVVDSSLKYNGVHVVEYGEKAYYFITNTDAVIDYANPEPKENLISDDVKFKTFDVKYRVYRELEYEKLKGLVMVCVPAFSSPRKCEIEETPDDDILRSSKRFIDKFKAIDRELYSDECDLDIAAAIHSYVNTNKKCEGLLEVDIDELDMHIILYDSKIASAIIDKNRKNIEFFSTGLGVMLEFFDKEVMSKFREFTVLGDYKGGLEFAKSCWKTLLEIYREKSLEEYDKEIKKVNDNNSIEDFEKEYLLTNLQSDKDKIKELIFDEYLDLIDNPNYLIKYWPFTNVNLESSDSVLVNLGGVSVDEKFKGNEELKRKQVFISNEYFFKLISIIKKYVPDVSISVEDSRELFSNIDLNNNSLIPEEQKQKILLIKNSLVNAKKEKLTQIKNKMVESLLNEKNEVDDKSIKDEIQEIITLIESTQEDINKLSPNYSTVEILDFWPPALYPVPNELNPNK